MPSSTSDSVWESSKNDSSGSVAAPDPAPELEFERLSADCWRGAAPHMGTSRVFQHVSRVVTAHAGGFLMDPENGMKGTNINAVILNP